MNVFIVGPRAISKLEKPIEERLYHIYENNFTVFVGDANGIDKTVQEYFHKLNYSNVTVFASQGIARNNIGDWPIKKISVDRSVKGFQFYVQKDMAMASEADYGFMIWNGESKGTLNNILNLVNKDKKVLIYLEPNKRFIAVEGKEKLNSLISFCSKKTQDLYSKLDTTLLNVDNQITLFEL